MTIETDKLTSLLSKKVQLSNQNRSVNRTFKTKALYKPINENSITDF
jgi:hypothetical protein